MNSTIRTPSPRTIRIEILNGTDQVFHPGDKVSGAIVLDPPNARVCSAKVELWGVCDTKSPVWGFNFRNRYISPKNHTHLFRNEKQLTINNHRIEPFQMEFPECTNAEDVSRKINRLADGSLPLPPTFRVTKGNDADHAIGSIQYFVSAEVSSERADGQGRSQHRARIELQAGLRMSERVPSIASQATFKLHPVSRRCSDWRFGITSFKERLLRICPGNWFEPRLVIVPTVTIPPVFYTGTKHVFRLELDSERSDVDLALMPVQNLENAKIVLESHTDVAGYKFFKRQRCIQDSQIVHERGVLFPIQQRMTEIMITIPESSTPDFVTYTLQHTHKLKFSATVRIGREPFPVQSYSPIRIVPRPELEYICPVHGLTYSRDTSMMNTPRVLQSPSTVSSICTMCRQADAESAARALMEPIQEDLSPSDVHSLNTADDVQAEDQLLVRPKPQQRQDSAGAEHDGRLKAKDTLLDTTAAEKDGLQPNRSDSAYVSAFELEKSKSISSLHLEQADKAAGETASPEEENARADNSESPGQMHLAPGDKAAGKKMSLDEKTASEDESESPAQMHLAPGEEAEGKNMSLEEKRDGEDKLDVLDKMQIPASTT